MSRSRLFGPLVVAGLSTLAVCLPAAVGGAGSAAAAPGPGRHPAHITAPSRPGKATDAAALAADAAGGLPAGGVLGDVTGDGLADILAIDPAGNLWLYPNTGGTGTSTFGARSQVGQGWAGYTLVAVASLYGNPRAGLLAVAPDGGLYYYPNSDGGNDFNTFGAPSLVGILWTDNTVVGVADLYGTGAPGILDIADAGNPVGNVVGNLYYYASQGGTGLNTFSFGSNVGQGWTGYTADLADINGDGKPDILAVDSAGNLWLYPNNGSTTLPFAGRSQVGSGWLGYQAIDVGQLTSTGPAGILAIDPAGNLWYYPNTGTGTFGTRTQVGTGWTGYLIN